MTLFLHIQDICKLAAGLKNLMAAKVLLALLRQIGSGTCSHLSLHQGADHCTCIEVAQVIVGLPSAHKDNGLARDVCH